jgi:hypothetical protein
LEWHDILLKKIRAPGLYPPQSQIELFNKGQAKLGPLGGYLAPDWPRLAEKNEIP